MRSLPWSEQFDAVVSWFTSFGYFEDEQNRRVLEEAFRALKAGGRLAIEMPNRDAILRTYQDDTVVERGEDFMIAAAGSSSRAGGSTPERTVIRGGAVRRFHFFVRLFTPAELRDWLLAAGFARVDVRGEDGEPLSLAHRRMVLVARK